MMRHLPELFFCIGLSACAVGPNFTPPAPPAATRYTAAPLPKQTEAASGVVQHFDEGRDIPAQWWILFHNDALDKMIRQAMKDSPTLAAAEARLRQAQENHQAATGALLPQVGAGASAKREKFSTSAIGLSGAGAIPSSILFNLYNASVNVSYTLDLFGGVRRQVEALGAEVEYQRFELEAAHLSLAGNIVTAAFKAASLQAQINATQQMVHDEEERLVIVEKQYRVGGISKKDVLAQRTQAEQTKAQLPPLAQALAQTQHQLATYMGTTPAEAALPDLAITSFTLPQELPVSLPSSLVRQRPDVRAAEARLHAASAQIGIATANLLPQISLSASYGPEATHVRDLFKSDSMIWSLGSSLTQPIFHGGELLAKRRAAIAAYDEAAANYRQAVLQAFQNVADSLKALEADAKTLKETVSAAAQAKQNFDIVDQQYKLGGASYLELLSAERAWQQTRLALSQAQAARFADTAALFTALGGGWWSEQPAT